MLKAKEVFTGYYKQRRLIVSVPKPKGNTDDRHSTIQMERKL